MCADGNVVPRVLRWGMLSDASRKVSVDKCLTLVKGRLCTPLFPKGRMATAKSNNWRSTGPLLEQWKEKKTSRELEMVVGYVCSFLHRRTHLTVQVVELTEGTQRRTSTGATKNTSSTLVLRFRSENIPEGSPLSTSCFDSC